MSTEDGHSPSSIAVLGQVLAEARRLLGRSPEQVGEATGLAGRTIRRLESGLVLRPHRTTLEALADIYALDPHVLRQLVSWADLEEDRVLDELRRLSDEANTDLGAV